MKKPSPEKLRELRTVLKAAYDTVLAEDHSSFHDLLNAPAFREPSAAAGGGHGGAPTSPELGAKRAGGRPVP